MDYDCEFHYDYDERLGLLRKISIEIHAEECLTASSHRVDSKLTVLLCQFALLHEYDYS